MLIWQWIRISLSGIDCHDFYCQVVPDLNLCMPQESLLVSGGMCI